MEGFFAALLTKKKSSEACRVHFMWTEFFLSEDKSLEENVA
mgnify:CR=1 FL=1